MTLGDETNREKTRKRAIANLPTPEPKQKIFLESEADITLFGGGAGGGKSFAILLDFAQPDLISDPNYTGVIFRRTFPQVRNEGGLWGEAGKIYPAIGGVPNQSRLEYKFPSGATIRFAHLQHDKNKYDWQGSQIPRIGWDELTHFTEEQFFYLLSRNRSPYGIPPKIKATCNPDADSWVAKLVDWYLDPEGYPDPEKAGAIRYFLRHEGKLEWGGSIAELSDRLSLSEEVVEERARTFAFIPALLADNPKLLAANPEYKANLESQHPVERARLLGGNWKARFEQGTIFDRSWFAIADSLPSRGRECRFWDFAATAKDVAKRSSFYTVGVKVRWYKGTYWIVDVDASQLGPGEVDERVLAIARQDGRGCAQRWELEGGSAGLHFEQLLKNKLKGFDARGVKPQGDKITRSINTARLACEGSVRLLRAPWNERFLAAVQGFDGSPIPLTNDIVDATNGAIAELYQDKSDLYQRVFK